MSRIDDKKPTTRGTDSNPDPITGAKGSHPVGTGAGALGGGAVGAAVGTAVGGPVGGVAGAAIGAVAGGLAGKGGAEAFDPTVETTYWRTEYPNRAYYDKKTDYVEYEPAYRYGWESRQRFNDRSWDDVEMDLESGWGKVRGKSSLTWERAKAAVRDSWDRMTGDKNSNKYNHR